MFSYRLFTLFCIMFVSSESTLGQNNNKKCAEFNEYCQNHWECCSNSCMSYLYRCTRGYNVNQPSYQEAPNKPPVTLEELVAMTFGQGNIVKPNQISKSESKPAKHFDNDDSINEIKIILQNADGSTEGSLTQDENTLLYATRFGENELINKESGGVEVILQASKDQETFTTESQLITDKTIETDEPCKEIGYKCYTNDECCSKRCHGFLHKCVT